MLFPLNKYLVVQPINEQKKDFGFLVPEDVDVEASQYKLVQLIEPHSESNLRAGTRLVVPTHTIEEVDFFENKYYLVLENYVVGFFEEIHEE